MIFNGKIRDITEADLASLIGYQEDKTVDFKRDAYTAPPKEAPSEAKEKWKHELCKDVSAFANASGGWIICGIKEENGVASDICGLGEIDADHEILRLGQCADNGIEPRIANLHLEAVDLPEIGKGKAIAIYVPRSFAAPHRAKDSKFYIRRVNRNIEMDMRELRTAFNLSAHLVDRVRAFRKERVEALLLNKQEEIPVLLEEGVRIILHAIPLSFPESNTVLDLSAFRPSQSAKWVYQSSLDRGRFNLEGYVKPRGQEGQVVKTRGYIQVFRNGIIECVEVIPLLYKEEENTIHPVYVEDHVLATFDDVKTIQENLQVELPIILMLSLTGVKGRLMVTRDRWTDRDNPNIANKVTLNNEKLAIPEIMFDNYNLDPKILMKPIFDMLWNAGGWERSMSYDEEGNWRQKDY